MKNSLRFFVENQFYKGKITYQRLKDIVYSYGFSLFEYDLRSNDEIIDLLHSCNLVNYAEFTGCFTYIDDDYHKYVFIRSGETEKDKVYMLLHELGHIYNEHFTAKGLIHYTGTAKEKKANFFASVQLHLNSVFRTIPCLIILLVCTGLMFGNHSYKSSDKEIEIVYYTQNGEVYHLFDDCYYLKNSTIISGSLESCSKKRICVICEERKKD